VSGPRSTSTLARASGAGNGNAPLRYGRPMTAASLAALAAFNAARVLTVLPPCANPACGKPRKRLPCGRLPGVRGWCSACTSRYYKAWRETGYPPLAPPPPVPAAERTRRSGAASRAAKEQRVTWYAESRDMGFTVAEAAADAGVTEAHARRRYEPLYVASRQAPRRAA
jgi:hypothetical protein